MTPVNTLDGIVRRQSIDGQDIQVPLVELTSSGAYVPNASALSVEEFGKSYTAQDAQAVADMVRAGGDANAQREQAKIDNEMRLIAGDQNLTPEQRAEAMAQVRQKQVALHHGFLQSQGLGQGVRSGLGTGDPNVPMMEQVQSVMAELQKRYPNEPPEKLYDLALLMLREGRGRAIADGNIPASVQAESDMAKRAKEEAEKPKRLSREEKVALSQKYIARGFSPEEVEVAIEALQFGETETLTQLDRMGIERTKLEQIRAARSVSDADVRNHIIQSVLGEDSQYQALYRRFQDLQALKAEEQGNSTKKQSEMGIFKGTEEWNKLFGQGGEFAQLNDQIRRQIAAATSDPDNVSKARNALLDKNKAPKFRNIRDENSQLLIVDAAMDGDKAALSEMLGNETTEFLLAIIASQPQVRPVEAVPHGFDDWWSFSYVDGVGDINSNVSMMVEQLGRLSGQGISSEKLEKAFKDLSSMRGVLARHGIYVPSTSTHKDIMKKLERTKKSNPQGAPSTPSAPSAPSTPSAPAGNAPPPGARASAGRPIEDDDFGVTEADGLGANPVYMVASNPSKGNDAALNMGLAPIQMALNAGLLGDGTESFTPAEFMRRLSQTIQDQEARDEADDREQEDRPGNPKLMRKGLTREFESQDLEKGSKWMLGKVDQVLSGFRQASGAMPFVKSSAKVAADLIPNAIGQFATSDLVKEPSEFGFYGSGDMVRDTQQQTNANQAMSRLMGNARDLVLEGMTPSARKNPAEIQKRIDYVAGRMVRNEEDRALFVEELKKQFDLE